MANAYDELVDLVQDWANREESALPSHIAQSALRYAADEAYRKLEIPPLEHSTYIIFADNTQGNREFVTGVDSNNISFGTVDRDTIQARANAGEFYVPGDAVTFIHLRVLGKAQRDMDGKIMVSNGIPSVESDNRLTGIIFNEKTDIRTYYDFFADKTAYNFWTRHGNRILLAGDIEEDTVVELHYYRRLPALNARLSVPEDLSGVTVVNEQFTLDNITYEALTALPSDISRLEEDTYTLRDINSVSYYVRSTTLISNWLRDENERVLLFGALHRAFDYLQEPQEAEKYKMRFMEAIQELNMEERDRKASGGNIQINYNGFGQI